MADFKVPNLCGASPEFNAIQNKFDYPVMKHGHNQYNPRFNI